MAKEPEARYQSAAELAQALMRVGKRCDLIEPLTLSRMARDEHPRPERRRRPHAQAGIAIAAMVLLPLLAHAVTWAVLPGPPDLSHAKTLSIGEKRVLDPVPTVVPTLAPPAEQAQPKRRYARRSDYRRTLETADQLARPAPTPVVLAANQRESIPPNPYLQ
jgi:hypothetical protein